MRRPYFSVVIPTYNRAQLLQRAIASVQGQTYRDFELIVVDDASRDTTPHVAERHVGDGFKYLRLSENQGNAAARNAGARCASGKILSYLDDDDEFLPKFLHQTHDAFESHPEAGWSWSGVVHAPSSATDAPTKVLWKPATTGLEETYLAFLRDRRIGTNCGFCVRRKCFESLGGFDSALRAAVDTDFLIRLARAYRFVVVNDYLVRLHDHPGPRVHRQLHHRAEAYLRIRDKHLETLRSHSALWADFHYKLGWLHCHAGWLKEGRSFLATAVRSRPTELRYLGAFLLFSVLGPLGPSAHRCFSQLHRSLTSRT